MRGGMLIGEPEYGHNILIELAKDGLYTDDVDIEVARVHLDVLKKLRECDLLKKEDITQFDLLYYSCRSPICRDIFEYLADWCPEALKANVFTDDPREVGYPLIHYCVVDGWIR